MIAGFHIETLRKFPMPPSPACTGCYSERCDGHLEADQRRTINKPITSHTMLLGLIIDVSGSCDRRGAPFQLMLYTVELLGSRSIKNAHAWILHPMFCFYSILLGVNVWRAIPDEHIIYFDMEDLRLGLQIRIGSCIKTPSKNESYFSHPTLFINVQWAVSPAFLLLYVYGVQYLQVSVGHQRVYWKMGITPQNSVRLYYKTIPCRGYPYTLLPGDLSFKG